jgi:hypothetical protein
VHGALLPVTKPVWARVWRAPTSATALPSQSFARFGGSSHDVELDNVKFAKLARDCGLVTKKCTRTDIDLIFTQVGPRSPTPTPPPSAHHPIPQPFACVCLCVRTTVRVCCGVCVAGEG